VLQSIADNGGGTTGYNMHPYAIYDYIL